MSQPSSRSDHSDPPTARFAQLFRQADSSLERLLVQAVRAVYWKSQTTTSPTTPITDSTSLATATAIEIQRRIAVYERSATIHLCQGVVGPQDESIGSEAPLVASGHLSEPSWITDSREHTWVELITSTDSHHYLIDPAAPPQITQQPGLRPLILPLSSDRQPQYHQQSVTEVDDSATLPLETIAWDQSVPTWPFGIPDPVNPVPADGGTDITANSIVQLDAKTGLQQLPTDSLDVIITSPPYRLQRSYNDAVSVWDADVDCSHDWEQQTFKTETPIRTSGGAGFNSDGTADELQDERTRTSAICRHCGAWKGELGHEPTIDQFVNHLMTVFNACQRPLADDGSLFINIGDSYAAQQRRIDTATPDHSYRDAPPKSLVALPERLKLAMIKAGWIAREHYIWVKPNPTPDPAPDRAGKAYEHIYRFVQSQSYQHTNDLPDNNILYAETATGDDSTTAPMPSELPLRLLEATLDPGADAVVGDPFAGTGTTLIAAAERDHDYLGFEIDPDALETARQQLASYDRPARPLSGQSPLTSFTSVNQ